MREGGADFIAEITAGRHRAWLYNGRDPHRIGPRTSATTWDTRSASLINQAATDRKEAFRKRVKMEEPAEILKNSRYAERFAKPTSTA